MNAPRIAGSANRGNPALDADGFRQCLAQFATGVTVVTVTYRNCLAGVTANSFASVSLDPPLILWSIKRSSSFLPALKAARHFAVNILSLEQEVLAREFAARTADKFSDVSWRPAASGAPILDGVVAWFDCRLAAEYDGGDHLIILGHVDEYAQRGGSVLLFANGRFDSIGETRPLRASVPETGFEAAPWDMPLLAASHLRNS